MGKKQKEIIVDPLKSSPLHNTLFGNKGNERGTGDTYTTGVKGGLDKLTRDILPEDLAYIDDYRGERQSTAEKWKNGATKAVGNLAIRAIDGFATIPYVLGLGMLSDEKDQSYLESIYNNPLSRELQSMSDSLREALPNYQTQEEQDSLLESMTGANFWADKFLDGASYAGAAYLSGLGVSKGIGAMRGVFGNLNKSANLLKSGTTVDDLIREGVNLTKQNGTAKRVGDFFQQAAATTFASAFEASAEARDTYDSVKEKLISNKLAEKQRNGDESFLTEEDLNEIEDKATSAGNFSFGTNILLTGTANYLQLGKYFKSAKHSPTAIDMSKVTGELGSLKAKPLTKSQKFFDNFAKPTWDNVGSEAGQEVGQLAVGEFLTDYYTSKSQDGEQFNKSFLEAMHKSFATKEGWESAILGALIGGGTGLATGAFKEGSRNATKLNQAIEIANSISADKKNFIQKGLSDLNNSQERQLAKTKSAENGDKFSYIGLSELDLHHMVSKASDTGVFDNFIEDLESAKDLSDAEFKEQFSVDNITNKNEFIDETIEKSKKLKKTYDKIRDVHGHKLNNEQLGIISTIASIADNSSARQNEIFETLKNDFDFDLKASVFDKTVGFNRDFDLLNDLNTELGTQQSRKAETETNIKNASDSINKTKFKNELKSINSEIARLGNDIQQLSNDENQIVDEQNYAKIIANMSVKTVNKLNERARRGKRNSILNPTRRQEFENLLSDFNRLEVTKNQFIDAYNQLTNEDSYQKEFKKLQDKIDSRNKKNKLDSLFTIKTPQSIKNNDEFGNEFETIQEADLEIKEGIYTGNVEQDSYVQDGESVKVDTPNNIYEIKDRRIRETPSGRNIPEVLVSINEGKDKWISIDKLKNKKLNPVNNNLLSAEQVFYNKYKNRLITIEYEEGYTASELAELRKQNQQQYDLNKEAIDNGDDSVNLNDGIIIGGKKLNNGKPKMTKKVGFLGLNRQGNVTFRTWNDDTKTFDKLQEGYLSEPQFDGNQNVSGYQFQVSRDTINGDYYVPKTDYTNIASKQRSDRYLMGKFIDNRIEEINDELNNLFSDSKKSIKEINDVKRNVRLARLNLGKVVDNKSKFLVLSNLISKLTNSQTELTDKINQQNEAMLLLHSELKELQNQKDSNTFTESKLIKAVRNSVVPFELEAQIIIDNIESKYENDLKIIDSLSNSIETLEGNISNTILTNYEQDVDNMLIEAGLDPSTLSKEDKLDFISSDLKLTLDTLGVSDLALQSEVNDLQDMISHLNNFENVITNDLNQQIENQLGFIYPFDSLQQLKDYSKSKGIADLSLLEHAYKNLGIDYGSNLQSAILRSELAAFEKLKQDALLDERLVNRNQEASKLFSDDFDSEIIETSELDDYDTEADGKVPSFEHNGDFTLAGMEHVPFLKTTNQNVETIEDTDDNTKKSKFVFNNAVALLDNKEYFVEITDTLADETGGDSSKYPVSAKAKGSLYTIIVDKSGNRVKFDLTGKPTTDTDGLIAHAVLPTAKWQTKSETDGKSYNRFNNIDVTNITPEQQKSIDEYQKLRDKLTSKLAAGDKIFYTINSKSLGLRKTGSENNKLSDVIDYDFTDDNQSVVYGTGLITDIGDGDKYKTYPGKLYFINKTTKQTVPLKTRKVNEGEIENIVNALRYFEANHDVNSNDIIDAISTYLLWGNNELNTNGVSYKIEFVPDSNLSEISFEGYYIDPDTNTRKKIKDKIKLSELIEGNTKLDKFRTFLGGINKQVYPKKLQRAIDRRKVGENNPYEVKIFTPSGYTTETFNDYFQYVLESDNPSLSTKMIKNSNSATGGIIKPQWVGAYLRLGYQTPVSKKLTRNSTIEQEPKMTNLESDAYKKASERLQTRYGINVSKVTGLIDNDAYGLFQSSGEVLISEDAPVGTDFHEEFHIVEELYLSADEKKHIYSEWRKVNNKEATDAEVSESLAEEFRYYALNQELKNDKNKGGLIERFVKSLYEFIENMLSLKNSRDIHDLFDAIYEGKFQNKPQLQGDKFTDYQMYQLNKSLQQFIPENATKEEFLTNLNNINNDSLRQKIENNIDSVYNYWNDNKPVSTVEKILNSIPESNNSNETISNVVGLPQSMRLTNQLKTDLENSNGVNDFITKLRSSGTPNNNRLADKLENVTESEQNEFIGNKFEKEKSEIRRKAIENGNYKIAPNGQPSNLTGEQGEQNLDQVSKEVKNSEVVQQLQKTGLAKKVHTLSPRQIEQELIRRGVDSNVAKQVSAWHGSPHLFQKFLTGFIGTGEGVQAFGWGLYFTDLEGIARQYAKDLADSTLNNYIEEFDNKLNTKYENFYDIVNNLSEGKFLNESWRKEADKLIKEEIEFYKSEYKDVGISSKEAKENLKLLNELILDINNIPNRNLYKVSLHKGKQPSEYTWLEWDKEVSKRQLEDISRNVLDKTLTINTTGIFQFQKNGVFYRGEKTNNKWNFTNRNTGEAINYNEVSNAWQELYNQEVLNKKEFKFYKRLEDFLESDKNASLFLLKSGIDGIKYLGESISRGATSDTARGFNYVVFDENAVTVEEVVQFQKEGIGLLPNGFVDLNTKEVFLNQETANLDTPIHEFAHLYNQALKQNNPKLYQRGIDLLNQELGKENSEIQEVIDYVKTTQPNLQGEALAEEILTEITGRRGIELLEKHGDKKSGIIAWLKEAFEAIKQILGLSKMSNEQAMNLSLQEFSDAIATDLLRGEELKFKNEAQAIKEISKDKLLAVHNNQTEARKELQQIKVKVIENKIKNKINNDENLSSLRPLSNDLNKDLLAYIMQNKSNNDRRQLTLNLDDFIRKNKDKMNNYFINSLNANLNINENVNRKDFENSIEELYSVNPDLVVNILKLDMMNNGDLYQFASDKINQEVFGNFNIDNMNFANINDLIVLNNGNLVETYEDGVIPVDKDYGRLPVTDEFGVSYNQLHKKINSNVYVELHLNENINNFSDKAVIQIQREMNFENKKRRLNRLKIEEGNC